MHGHAKCAAERGVVAWPIYVAPAVVFYAEFVVFKWNELHGAVRLRGDGRRIARKPAHIMDSDASLMSYLVFARDLGSFAREICVGVAFGVTFEPKLRHRVELYAAFRCGRRSRAHRRKRREPIKFVPRAGAAHYFEFSAWILDTQSARLKYGKMIAARRGQPPRGY
jgi:hypothetical protein